MRRLGLLTFFLALTGCSFSIHEVHVSDFDGVPESGGKIIEAQAEQFTILGFKRETDYVDKAREELEGKCKGRIQGITTQFSTAHGFFSWTNKIKMQGLCIAKG